MIDLAGKVAIVTGAGQGMGRAVAKRLASGGARVLVNDLNGAAADRTAAAIADVYEELCSAAANGVQPAP